MPLGYPCDAFEEQPRNKSASCPNYDIDCSQARFSRYRSIDGSCNHLTKGLMGATNAPFHRYVPKSISQNRLFDFPHNKLRSKN